MRHVSTSGLEIPVSSNTAFSTVTIMMFIPQIWLHSCHHYSGIHVPFISNLSDPTLFQILPSQNIHPLKFPPCSYLFFFLMVVHLQRFRRNINSNNLTELRESTKVKDWSPQTTNIKKKVMKAKYCFYLVFLSKYIKLVLLVLSYIPLNSDLNAFWS